jgi:gluconokinase
VTERPSPLVLAIDVGTSSVRAALYDARAHRREESAAHEKHALVPGPDGAVEAPAEELAACVEHVVDAVLAAAGGGAGTIAAVGLDTLASTLVGADASGRAVTPLYTYADRRPGQDVLELRRELDGAAVLQRTGCPLHAAYWPARLRWLGRERRADAARVASWLDLGTYLYRRWFARADVPASYSIASWTGLLDRRALRWDAPLLRHLGVAPSALPPLADHTAGQRGLAAAFNRRWPALAGAAFFPAVGDGAAANVGSGCVSPARIALTVGTTGALRVVLPGAMPDVPPGLWAYKVGAAETLLGGSLSAGGNIFAWARETLRLPAGPELEATLRGLPPDGHGLTVLPHLAGERSPGWATTATGAVAGVTLATRPVQLVQACLEAVCYRFAAVARLLDPCLDESRAIVASGGALTASPAWVQMMADVLQHRVLLSHEPELTSRGTAILALRGLRAWSSLDDVALPVLEPCAPDPARAGVYRRAMERQGRLYDALISRDERARAPAVGRAAPAAGPPRAAPRRGPRGAGRSGPGTRRR